MVPTYKTIYTPSDENLIKWFKASGTTVHRGYILRRVFTLLVGYIDIAKQVVCFGYFKRWNSLQLNKYLNAGKGPFLIFIMLGAKVVKCRIFIHVSKIIKYIDLFLSIAEHYAQKNHSIISMFRTHNDV